MTPSNPYRTIIFQTDRLFAYEMEVGDAKAVFELNNDPEVLRFTGDPPFNSVDDARQFIVNYDAYEKTKMGRWSLRLNGTDEYIGWCGLKKHRNGEVDIGFRLKQSFWNQGYATEAAKAAIKYAFDYFEIDYLIGRAMKENAASLKVLEKIGMKYWKPVHDDLHDGLCYRIDREEFINS